MPTASPLTLRERLQDEAELDRLCALIIEHGSVRAACRSYGVDDSTLWRAAHNNEPVLTMIRAAQRTNAERALEECREIADAATPETVRVAETRIKQRMWHAEKLLRTVYGANPAVSITNNTANIVCDEATRQRLIALRERLTGDVAGLRDAKTERETITTIGHA